jgi:CHAD domain-containing protein
VTTSEVAGRRPKGRRDVHEVETKFSVHGLFAVPDLAAAHPAIGVVARSQPRTLRATYFDSPTLQLARAGITLRYRTGEGAPVWTLKLPADKGEGERERGLSRDEISVNGAAGQPPEELTRMLLGVLRGTQVTAVSVLRTRREVLELCQDDRVVLAEVVDDTVSVMDGRRVVSRFREIEVEERGGPSSAQVCTAVGERLVAAGAVAGEQLPKLVRALGPRAQEPDDLPVPPEVTPGSPVGDLVLWSLRTGLARLVAADLAVRRGSPDSVHQLRVSCRRLRSDLRTFRDLVEDERIDGLRAELFWLAGAFSEARDLEVLRERVLRTASADPLAPLDPLGIDTVETLLHDQEALALQRAVATLDTQRHVALLELLLAVASRPVLAPLASRPCRDVLPAVVGRAWHHLAKRARRLGIEDPDRDWHRTRILAKRCRYAAEVAAVALGKPAGATASAATALQEVLGEHQDAAAAADRMLDLALLAPGDLTLALTCGRLAERERVALRAVRAAFPPLWGRLRTGRATRWLRP